MLRTLLVIGLVCSLIAGGGCENNKDHAGKREVSIDIRGSG